jgi:hypothetical protein
MAILCYQKHKHTDLYLQINNSQVIDANHEIHRAAPSVGAAHFVRISESDVDGDVANYPTGRPH